MNDAQRKKRIKKNQAAKSATGGRRDPLKQKSPCAVKCRHTWCDGYNTGYFDGHSDSEVDVRNSDRYRL